MLSRLDCQIVLDSIPEKRLATYLSGFSDRERNIFWLCVKGTLTQAQIGKQFGVSQAFISKEFSRLMRAIARVRLSEMENANASRFA